MTPNQPICVECIYYFGLKKDIFVCKAFPKGIPKEILTGEHDHTKPFNGDNGIRFESIKEEG